MKLETLCEKSKSISIFCIFLNLFVILILQCILFFQTEIITTGKTSCESDSTTQQNINTLTAQKGICSNSLKRIARSQKTCSENRYWIKHAAMAGATFIEEFVALPINVLLFFAAKYKKKSMLIPWLIFSLQRFVAIVTIVCLFVIFNVIGIDQFIGETGIVVSISGDNRQQLPSSKRYIPK